MELREIENDKDRLAQELMESLWAVDSFSAAADMENTLSTVICLTEEMIHAGQSVSFETFDLAMRRRRAILKRIADALVWQMFGSNSKFIRAYALGKNPGFMAGKAGYLGERLVVAKAQDFLPEPYRSRARCVFAVQNDITNCLRFGDVTCLLDDGTIVPFEIKTGKKTRGSRQRRQAERHDAVTEYLATDFTANPLLTDLPLKRIVNDEHESSYAWKIIDSVVKSVTTSNRGAWQAIDDCMLVVALDSLEEAVMQSYIAGAITTVGWDVAELRFGSLDRHVATRDDEVLSSVMPIMNWRIAHDVIMDIVLQKILVLVFVNVGVLRESARRKGVDVEPIRDAEPFELALSAVGPYERIVVAPGMWDRLIYELLTIPSFIAQLKLILIAQSLVSSQSSDA